MILLAIILIAALITIASVVVITIFKPRWSWLYHVMGVALAITIAFGLATGLTARGCRVAVDELRQEYENILLYYDLIDTCDNEYVRFDFYNRVERYNNQYEVLREDTDSAWVGALYPDNWYEEFSVVNFLLRDGSGNTTYPGVYDEPAG